MGRGKKRKRILLQRVLILSMLWLSTFCCIFVKAEETEAESPGSLYATSACLYDAAAGRVLYEKNAQTRLPMASTTKIMTLLVILENATLDEVVQVSSNAARQPDVQLNINTGEQYYVKDLLYSLMLESHNDVAVALAEHVGGSVEGFCAMMNRKAAELGLTDTCFETPNGLDSENHFTTAVELAKIAAYALKNEDFIKITNTSSYQFNELTTGRSFTVSNKNRFLYMMEGAIGMKTGFTGRAGYCFVGALRRDGYELVSVVLASGWPPHKEYKWSDTKKLMNYGLEYFKQENIWQRSEIYINDELYQENIAWEDYSTPFSALCSFIPATLPVTDGARATVSLALQDTALEENMLLAEWEEVKVYIEYLSGLAAPVSRETVVGVVRAEVNGETRAAFEIRTTEEVGRFDFAYCIRQILKLWGSHKK